MSEEIKLPNILVTGTPGVGKTSFSMLLTDNLNERLQNCAKQFTYINIGKLITDKKLYTDWNKEFDVPEFDDDKVLDELEPLLAQGGIVLDFHSSSFLPEELIDLVVLIRCDNTILYDRLKARNYSDKKIKENIECEIMEVTSEEVRESFPENKILELRGEQVDDMSKNMDSVITAMNNLIKI
jgi:adenylate kinase